jgi:hypothetical protein
LSSAGALGKASQALGKGFAECHTRQRSLGKDFISKNFFAECKKSTLGKVFNECQARTRQKNNCHQHHSAKNPFFLKKTFLKIVFAEWCQLALGKIDLFAECQALALGKTREVAAFVAFFLILPSATPLALGKAFFAQCWHSAKLGNLLFFVCCFPSMQTRKTHI